MIKKYFLSENKDLKLSENFKLREFACADKSDEVLVSDELVDLLQKVRNVLPVENIPAPSMTGEDFGWYQQFIPGVFFFLGLGDVPALHTDTFDFDDSVLTRGADFFKKLAEVLS